MLNPVGCPCMGAGPGAPPLAWSPTMPQPALHEAGSAAGSFFVPKEEEGQESEGKVSVRSGGPATSRGPACMPNATGVAAATSSGPPAPPAAGGPLSHPPSPPPAPRGLGFFWIFFKELHPSISCMPTLKSPACRYYCLPANCSIGHLLLEEALR
nr:myosin-1-like isoform X1 [Equus asinus]XP_044603281.1 myosin-1-like isoform X2 [Equus asinus]